MTSGARPLFSGRTDQRDWLVEAEVPLMALQASAGGVVPGPIHVPAVLQAVRQARAFGTAITRKISFCGERGRIHSSIHVQPEPTGNGCIVDFLTWQEDSSACHPRAAAEGPNPYVLRLFSQIVLQVDSENKIIAVQDFGDDTHEAARRFSENEGKCWQQGVEFDPPQTAFDHNCEGCSVKLVGSDRRWSPHILRSATGVKREIAFLPDDPPPEIPHQAEDNPDESLMNEALAPVLAQPVGRIIANSQTICSQLAGPLGANYARYAEDIVVSGEYLLSMLEDLSEVDLINDKEIKITRESVDLLDIAKKAMEMLSTASQKKHIRVIVPASAETVRAVGDNRRVLQIAINLLNNAIRYSPRGSVVTIRAWATDGRALLSVKDDGEGIDVAALSLVFEKFERLGRSGDGGTGLGLYISRRLAHAMNGELSVDSALGKGAEFVLSLAKDRRQG